MESLENSPWLDVYKKALQFVPSVESSSKIIDLGCGSGRFAKLLKMKDYTNYLGMDFAHELIKEARRYVPGYEFVKCSVLANKAKERFKEFDTFILLEILEHINQDLEVVSNIPSGSNMIFSLPNYMSKSHVRAFNNEDEVKQRYGHLIKFEDSDIWQAKRKWDHVPPSGGESVKMFSRIFIFKGVKL